MFYTMDTINEASAQAWRTRLRACMDERGLTQLGLVSALNRQYLTKYHQKDVSRWLNTGNERSFDMAHACEYIGLNHNAIQAIREWIGTGGDGQNANTGESSMREYRAQTLNDMLSSSTFAVLASKLLTLHEMSVIWRTNPSRFDSLMSSLASESDLPNTLTFQLVTEAFYGMANESFSALLRDAYPAPTERQFTQIQD